MNDPWGIALRIVLLLAGAILSVWIVVIATPLIQALIIAVLLAYLLDPFVRFLTNRTLIKRKNAARIVYLIFILFLVAIPIGLGTAAIGAVQRFEDSLTSLIADFERMISRPVSIYQWEFYPEVIINNIRLAAVGAISSIPEGSLNFLSVITTNVLWALVVIVCLYYFLIDGPDVKPWIVKWLPHKYRNDAGILIDQIDHIWSVFLRVQLLIFLVLAFLILAGSSIVIWLFTSGIIPFSIIWLIILLAIVYTLAQQVDNLWMRPYFLGKSLDLHPGIVFVGLIAAFAFTGILGALIFVPVLASIKAILIYFHGKLSTPLSDEDEIIAGEELNEQELIDNGRPT